ncbi:MAG TPA: hypothetical protein VHE32_14310 [Rhodanobacteraceae bacterium]|nr:hypothetical protein [Rhodanobacteraceae bacterium]
MLSLRVPLSSGGRRSWPWLALALASIAAGIWLRAWQLRAQVLIDDEWHAVHMLVGADAVRIATHFGYADYCIPLTLYYRWLFDLGMLSEWQMHLPLLLAGIVLLVVAPLMLRREFALPVRAVWIALMAISPVLVYLSRTARPYALACLLAFVAVVAFLRWHRGDGRRWAFAYAIACVAAAWLHLLTLAFTLWPFAWFGCAALRLMLRPVTRQDARRDIVRLMGLALAVVAGLAIVLGPPLVGDWHSMVAKAGTDAVSGATAYRSILMMLGISSAWPGAVLALAFGIGVRSAWRRERQFATIVAGMIVAGTLAIALARPAWVQHPQTFVRYTLPALPFVLLFVAEGIGVVLARAREPAFAAAVGALVIVALFAAGPLPGYYYAPNQLMGHELFQFDYDARENPYVTRLELGPVPAFYRDLASRPPGSITLIEAPAHLVSHYLPDPWYQAIHRQNVKYALLAPVCGGEADEIPPNADGARFRRLGKLADILDGATWGADYLVLRLHAWSVPPGVAQSWPDMTACVGKVSARLGSPVYSDGQLVVYALAGAGKPEQTPRR